MTIAGQGLIAFSIAGAPTAPSINLLVQVVMGLVLLAGKRLAQQGKFRAHAICQSSIVLLNLVPILCYMLPVFRLSVMSQPIGDLGGNSSYGVTALHGVTGALTEALAIYILLVAGKILPSALRFQNFKVWMRTTLALWWITIALGIGTFAVWQISSDNEQTGVQSRVPQSAPARPIVTARNFVFEPKELTISQGQTVTWKGVGGKHTIKADDGSFQSEVVAANGEFTFKFEKEGRYSYYCSLHGEPGGKDMAGVVIVRSTK